MNSNMQAVLILPSSPTFGFSYSPPQLDEFAQFSEKFTQHSRNKLNYDFKVNLMEEENLKNEAMLEEKRVVHGLEEDEMVEEEEFSFTCTNADVMSVWAEDVFVNGYIRPMFPYFNSNFPFSNRYDCGVHGSSTLWPPFNKVSIQRPGIASPSSSSSGSECNEWDGEPEGPFYEWSRQPVVEESSPKKCRKSNFIVLSELWRLRHKLSQSKNTSVSLRPSSASNCGTETEKIVVISEKMSSQRWESQGAVKERRAKWPRRLSKKITS